jgi:hypothetical protein
VQVRVALSPPLPRALNHRVVAGDVLLVQDGRDDDSHREMATHPDALALDPVGSRPLDHHACDQAT